MADRDRDTSTLLGADIESHHLVDAAKRAELERQAFAIDGCVGIEHDFVSPYDGSKISRVFYRFGPHHLPPFDINLANLVCKLPGFIRMMRDPAEGETLSEAQRHIDMQQRSGDYAATARTPPTTPNTRAEDSAAVNKVEDDQA